MAAIAIGLVMTMTGCGSVAKAPTGDALFRDGEKRYIAYSSVMHSVIMEIYEGEWNVDQGSYGVSPIPCRIDGEPRGYSFSWVRTLDQANLNVDAVVAAATMAFEAAEMKAETAIFGKGDREEINVIATGGDVGRGVVSIRPARDQISVSASSECFPGDAGALSNMIFASRPGDGDNTASQRFPGVEGPQWQPRFFYPEEGSPIYVNEDGTPVDPQPSQTEFPVAPYDK